MVRNVGESLRGDQRNRRNAIAHHQQKEWKTAIYRRVNDIINDTRPELQKYEWEMMEKDGTWQKYKKMNNVIAWVRLTQADLIWPCNVLRGTIDEVIRMEKWGDFEVQMGRFRTERYRGNRKLRKRVSILGG